METKFVTTTKKIVSRSGHTVRKGQTVEMPTEVADPLIAAKEVTEVAKSAVKK